MGGSPGLVNADVDLIERECLGLSLALNRAKCELITSDFASYEHSSQGQFARVDTSAATLLGAPLLPAEALLSTLDAGVADLTRALERLQHIARQDALLILRCSLAKA